MNRKAIIVLTSVTLIVILVLSVTTSVRYSNMGQLTTQIVPSDAVLRLEGKQIGGNRLVRISPGTYTVTVSRSGFASKIKKVTIKKGEKQSINFVLDPNSEEGLEWSRDHPKETAKGEGIVSKEVTGKMEDTSERNPIINRLPIVGSSWRIDYSASQKHPEDPTAVTIIIKSYDEAGKAEALDWMKTYNFNPADYDIVYASF